jgi:putative SOS response-associated peptidase YedK
MCGRYSLFAPQRVIERRFDATFADPFEPRYNVAPGQSVPVITGQARETIDTMEWGLLPRWADDPSMELINARAETIEEKPSFSDAVSRRRCLVLADGFYEWVDTGTGSQPYRIALEDDRPFALAGIWERWEGEIEQTSLDAFAGDTDDAGTETEVRETFAIVTTTPNDLVSQLHDRMAVILPEDDERDWLRADDPDTRASLLDPIDDERLTAEPVSTAVNDPSNDSPDLVEPIDDASSLG